MADACEGCGRTESCAPLWAEQRKCCPDCTCVDPQAEFRAKLKHWREHGAPGYIGPRAGRDT